MSAPRLRLVLLGLPMLPIVLIALALALYRQPQFHTGDQLLDAVLTATAAHFPQRLPPGDRDQLLFRHPLYDYALPRAALMRVLKRPDFARDPRAILLHARLLRDRAEDQPLTGDYERLPADLQLLRQAQADGVADAPLLFELFQASEDYWRRRVEGSSYEVRNGRLDDVQQAVRQQYGALQDALLAELRTAAPQEALPCYCQALARAGDGSYEQAIAALAEGNAQPLRSDFDGFPYDELAANNGALARQVGPVLSGALFTLSMPRAESSAELWTDNGVRYARPPAQYFDGALDSAHELEFAACRRQDAAGLQTVERSVERLLDFEGQARLGCDRANLMDLTFINLAISADWPGLDKGLESMLLARMNAIDSAATVLHAAHVDSRPRVWDGWQPGPDFRSAAYPVPLLDRRTAEAQEPVDIAGRSWQARARQRAALQPKFMPLWRQLVQFDYVKVLGSAAPPAQP